MKTVIDNLSSATGWSGSGGGSIYGVNDIKDYVAGNNSNSLIGMFTTSGGYIEKEYSVDVSDYSNITIWLYSREKGDPRNDAIGQFSYKIDFGGDEFYIKLSNKFSHITFSLEGVDSITRIRITSLHSDTDYLFMSYAVASEDLFPLDILTGIQEQLEYERDLLTARSLGTVTCSSGDNRLEFTSDFPYIDRYSAIKIVNGGTSEIHGLSDRTENTFLLSGLFDGPLIVNNFTDASVYLYYPVVFGTSQKEISLPSITLWGFSPIREVISSEFDEVIDSVNATDETYQIRQVGQYLNWDILIDCEERESYEILGELTKIVRNVLGKRVIWVNGRKVNIDWDNTSTEIEATENFDIVPKVQYPTTVQIIEEIYSRETVYPVSSDSIDVTIV